MSARQDGHRPIERYQSGMAGRSLAGKGILALFAGVLSMSSAMAMDYKEAPMLAELVKAGTLPPVAERLPKNPRVVQPGREGRQIRRHLAIRHGRRFRPQLAVPHRRLRAAARLGSRVERQGHSQPRGIGHQQRRTATEFTVKLRKGLKWSDGKPFGSDDIGFFVNDIVGNKELLPNARRLDGERRRGRQVREDRRHDASRSRSRNPTACSRSAWPASTACRSA